MRCGRCLIGHRPPAQVGLRDLRWALADVAGWANDLASGVGDAAAGQDNLVDLIAREEGLSAVAARSRAGAMIEERRASFHALAQTVRACPDVQGRQLEDLHRYIGLVERFMAATLDWLAGTGRFTAA
ncbi:terpene synthase family protein [Streptomyces xanthophaeus]|uniref:terpene synthase family protein n=1 Tax=Streptomyces xanthophaeus TaxID=67385 RepID=UPI00341FAC3B